MFGLGMPELIVILVIMLLLFGRRLPEVMRGMGRSVTEFKRGMNDVTETIDEVRSSEPPKEAPPAKVQGDKLEEQAAPDSASKSIGPADKENANAGELRSEIGG